MLKEDTIKPPVSMSEDLLKIIPFGLIRQITPLEIILPSIFVGAFPVTFITVIDESEGSFIISFSLFPISKSLHFKVILLDF